MIHPLMVRNSPYSVRETADRLEQLLKDKNIMVFARIDHGEAAREDGLALQDEEVLVFGDPKVGTGLMQECPPIGIELPLKMVIWKGDETMVGYRDLKHLRNEFSVPEHQVTLEKMSSLMDSLIETVTRP
jgi:uncharacterized protein (DUF302 family)